MALPLVNKTVRLSREQIAGLKKEAKLDRRDGWTSLVRIAVDEMLQDRRKRRSDPNAFHGELAGVGNGKDNGR